MTVVDSSIMVAVLWERDALHAASEAWLDAHLDAGGILVAPTLLRIEVAGAVARRGEDPLLGHQVVERLMAFPRLYLIPIVDELDVLATQPAADLRLRGAGAAYVAVAEYYNLPLFTWDREQIERGGQRIVAQQPDGSQDEGTDGERA